MKWSEYTTSIQKGAKLVFCFRMLWGKMKLTGELVTFNVSVYIVYLLSDNTMK